MVRGRENPQVKGKGEEEEGKQKTGGGGERAAGETGEPHGRTRGFTRCESISGEIRLVVRLDNGESKYGVDQREGDLAVLLGDAAPDTLLGIHFRHQDGCSVDERADWALHRYGEALHKSGHGPYCDCQACTLRRLAFFLRPLFMCPIPHKRQPPFLGTPTPPLAPPTHHPPDTHQ